MNMNSISVRNIAPGIQKATAPPQPIRFEPLNLGPMTISKQTAKDICLPELYEIYAKRSLIKGKKDTLTGGKNILRHYLYHPLRDRSEIAKIQAAVAELVEKPNLLANLRERLTLISNINTSTEILPDTYASSDSEEISREFAIYFLNDLRNQLNICQKIGKILSGVKSELLQELKSLFDFKSGTDCESLKELFSLLRGEEINISYNWKTAKSPRIEVIKKGKIKYNLEKHHRILIWAISEETANYTKSREALLKAASLLDYIQILAKVARDFGYTRPEIVENGILEIINGRHPILLDQSGKNPDLKNTVPNSTQMHPESNTLVITGPNENGKSTYLRQLALMFIQAQIGSFLSADSATISLVDNIFTHFNIEDVPLENISQGAAELLSAADWKEHSTSRSLSLFDEFFKTTDPAEGEKTFCAAVNLASQISQFSFFSTHYRKKLALLEEKTPGLQIKQVIVRETPEGNIPTFQIEAGISTVNYTLPFTEKYLGLEFTEKAREFEDSPKSDWQFIRSFPGQSFKITP